MSPFYLQSFFRSSLWSLLVVLLCVGSGMGTAQAADPGSAISSDAAISGQKAGSVLIYPIYTSSATSANVQNTKINITNLSTTSATSIHLFFVSDSCFPTDAFICLTPIQTATFLASDVDPGVSGFMIAIATDLNTGCPISFNFLQGDEWVKFATGHAAKLQAEAVAALFTGSLSGCNASSATATLFFNGSSTGYNQLPRTLALDSISSRADGNSTLLILCRIGGNLALSYPTIGTVSGTLYDGVAASGYPFSFSASCQLRTELRNSFPVTNPVFEIAIPSGKRGWLSLSATSDIGLVGAVVNFNANSTNLRSAFNGGQLLHALTLSTTNSLMMPVFPFSC